MERYDRAALGGLPAPELRNEGSLTSTLRTLLFFTALMITLPVGLYFSSKAYIFEGTLGMSNRDSYFYAAIVAVVTVHVVLALFVYVAWNEVEEGYETSCHIHTSSWAEKLFQSGGMLAVPGAAHSLQQSPQPVVPRTLWSEARMLSEC
ncbi:Vacuolar ATPase assembly integral membrane protein VMA21 isoform X2 [Aix galericulata]|nr:Vacuolar ATPase assembly integral membrane protein VMA21 isoform X2 [Aix galericulata]